MSIRINKNNSRNPKGKEVFFESFEESREDFFRLSKKIKKKFEFSNPDRIKFSKELDPIDIIWIRKKKKPSSKLIVISSGVHGVEGYAGSAVQRYLMQEIVSGDFVLECDILLLHGVNPFGFRNKKRVNENNVDLNRNFFFKREKIPKREKNRGYRRFSSFFTPRFPFTYWYLEYFVFFLRFTGIMLRVGIQKFSKAFVNGQFEFKKGIYFGGKKPESVVKRLRKYFKVKLLKYDSILHLDIHTGHGEENGLTLIQNADLGTPEDSNILLITDGLPLLKPASGGAFYKTAGDFTDFFSKIFPLQKNLFPLTVELGTAGNLSFWKAVRTSFLIVAENRIRHHGTWFESNKVKVDERFYRYFYPNSDRWRNIILHKTTDICKILSRRFVDLPHRD